MPNLNLAGPLTRTALWALRVLWAYVVLMPAAGQTARSQPAVYYVSIQGDDTGPGTPAQPWRHIEWAMTRSYLRGGDTIRVRGGVYRPASEVSPSRDSPTDETLIRPVASGDAGRPISVIAEPGEHVIFSGRRVAADWHPAGPGSNVYYFDYAAPLVFPYDYPFQLAQDRRLLYRTASFASLDRPGRYFVETALQRIYAWTSDSQPPAQHLMEYGISITGIEFRGRVQHWRVTGLELAGFRTAGVIIHDGAGSIELDHLDVSYIGAQRPGADPTNGYALSLYDTSGLNSIHDNNLHHTLAEAVHISQSGAGGDAYENNDIHDCGGAEWDQESGYGQALFGPGVILRGDHVTVRGNHVYNNGYHGLILESDLLGAEGPAAPSGNVIEGNTFAFNGGNGVYADGKNGVTPSQNDIIRFNLFNQNNQARPRSPTDADLRVGGNFDSALIYNNTIYASVSSGLLLYATSIASGTAQGRTAVPSRIRVLNNIGVEAGAESFLYPLRVVDVGPDLVADANNWYRTAGGAIASWAGSDYSRLDLFRSATGREARGMSADPRFVSAENNWFWLRAVSPMIGRGIADLLSDGSLMVGSGPQRESESSTAPPSLGAFPYKPLLELSAGALRVFKLLGSEDPPARELEIRSAGPAPMKWSASTDAPGWLRLNAPSGATPGSVSVTFSAGGLGVGLYSAAIQVMPSLEGEPAITVPVTFNLLPSPRRR